jgi:recombination protein RecT
MATQLATREPTAVTEYDRLRNGLEKRASDFKMALPAHISPEKFQRTVMTAAQSNPDLLRADRGSLITSCMKAAQDGLLPDGREAAIVTFNTSIKIDGEWRKIMQAQYMPMVFGLRKKILQSGEISAIETNVVYRREVEEGRFVFEGGTEAALRHRPMLDLSDEDLADENIIAAYSVATMKDGTKSFEVMRRAEINKVRQASQTGKLGGKYPPKGPWVDWFAEMARKTVMRRHSKTLPMSGDLIDVEAHELDLAARSATAVLGSVTPDAPRMLPTPPTRDDVANDEQYNPETGEVAREGDEESEEESARRLDAEQSAQERGLGEDTITPESPNAEEGPADEDRGEAHTDDPRAELVARLVNDIGTATDRAAIDTAETEFLKHRPAMEPEHVGQIEAMIAAARKRVRGE